MEIRVEEKVVDLIRHSKPIGKIITVKRLRELVKQGDLKKSDFPEYRVPITAEMLKWELD